MNKFILFAVLCVFLSCKGQKEPKNVSSFEYLSEEVLKTKTKEELRLIRNEIFAPKGYVFKNKELDTYFKSKFWYIPDTSVKISLSNKEQYYVNKIKELEQKTESKTSVDNIHCIDFIDINISGVYPLTNKKLLSKKIEELISSAENYHEYKFYEDIREYICEGKGTQIYNINCSSKIQNVFFITYCGQDPTSYIFSIKDEKIIKMVKVVDSSLRTSDEDSVTSGYYDTDFKLYKGGFEVYKVYMEWDEENSTEEYPYEVKEVRRELIAKYKLTENGIVKM